MSNSVRSLFTLFSALAFLIPTAPKAETISEAFPQMMDECLSWINNPIRSSLNSSWIELKGYEHTRGTVATKVYVLAHKEVPVLLEAKYAHDSSLPVIPIPTCTLKEISPDRPLDGLQTLDIGNAWDNVKPLPPQEMKAALLNWADEAVTSLGLVDITDGFLLPIPGSGKILADCSTNPTTLFQLYTDGVEETSMHKRMRVDITPFGQRYMCNDPSS